MINIHLQGDNGPQLKRLFLAVRGIEKLSYPIFQETMTEACVTSNLGETEVRKRLEQIGATVEMRPYDNKNGQRVNELTAHL